MKVILYVKIALASFLTLLVCNNEKNRLESDGSRSGLVLRGHIGGGLAGWDSRNLAASERYAASHCRVPCLNEAAWRAVKRDGSFTFLNGRYHHESGANLKCLT